MPAAQTEPPLSDLRETLVATIDSIERIVTMSREDLVVMALGSRDARPEADYLTLADAESGSDAFEFTELDSGGTVPTVQAKVGVKPLVVLAGETIVGGKQNRIINVTIWLPARKQTPIPVTCLEHGRWDAGYAFAAGRHVDLDFRAKVSATVDQQHGFRADQHAAWNEISMKEQLAARRSPTGALHDLYESEVADLNAFVSAFGVPDGANGLAIGIGGKLVALDLFDSPQTLRRQWPRLIGSAASAMLDYRRRVAAGWLPKAEHRYPDEGALGRMLARAKKATADARVGRSVGEGWDVRLATTKLHGSGLVHAGRVVHLALFRDEPPPKPQKPPTPEREYTPPPPPDYERTPTQEYEQHMRDLLERLGQRPDSDQGAGVPARVRTR